MKHYFLVRTSDSTYSGSYKFIAETFEEAENFLKNNELDWYAPKGTGSIFEVNQYMKELKRWYYFDGNCSEIFDYEKGDYLKV